MLNIAWFLHQIPIKTPFNLHIISNCTKLYKNKHHISWLTPSLSMTTPSYPHFSYGCDLFIFGAETWGLGRFFTLKLDDCLVDGFATARIPPRPLQLPQPHEARWAAQPGKRRWRLVQGINLTCRLFWQGYTQISCIHYFNRYPI